ncbi:glycosyltransferase family 4 protein [Maribacter halichondriae]|uniref:glycosyltransferase family 4 protein n=1 Tax=Maribacter halichondriae TaxID=2980554 RepID=UPI0023598B9D|nr:glycosyltransferase family 4 protein [Maribacter sp. Hal144]
MIPKIYHFTNISVDYRKALWSTLFQSKDFEYHVFFGKNKAIGIPEINRSVPEFDEYQDRFHSLRNFWYKGKYLFWQRGVISKCLTERPDMVILLDEFNIVSSWAAAVICRIRGIRLAFRGHGMYGNEKGLKLFLRKTFYKLADANLVYERRSKQVMIEQGFHSDRIHVVFNSLDYDQHRILREKYKDLSKNEVFNFFDKPELLTLFFIGRLTKVKKLDILLNAFDRLNSEEVRANLLIIGDGPEKKSLEAIAGNLSASKNIHFYGACREETEIGKFIATADLCVSPGNVGLTGIHCLSYGTPVCTHSNFALQMPEVEALEEGKSGFFFKQDDLEDLTNKLNLWLTSPKENRQEIRKKCYEIIDSYYNPYYQEKVMENLLKVGKPLSVEPAPSL